MSRGSQTAEREGHRFPGSEFLHGSQETKGESSVSVTSSRLLEMNLDFSP